MYFKIISALYNKKSRVLKNNLLILNLFYIFLHFFFLFSFPQLFGDQTSLKSLLKWSLAHRDAILLSNCLKGLFNCSSVPVKCGEEITGLLELLSFLLWKIIGYGMDNHIGSSPPSCVLWS